MLKENFMVGPFEVRPKSGDRADINYGYKTLATNVDIEGGTRNEVVESLSDCFARLRAELRERTAMHTINLVRADGELLGRFVCESFIVTGMTPGLIDDRSEYWIQSADRLYSMPTSIDAYAALVSRNASPSLAWVSNLMPEEVTTEDPNIWRAPTSWELRHVVGEWSFSGISGANAAKLVGMTPQNFRKYTAADGASTRQNISFSAWHLLLKKLGVTR